MDTQTHFDERPITAYAYNGKQPIALLHRATIRLETLTTAVPWHMNCNKDTYHHGDDFFIKVKDAVYIRSPKESEKSLEVYVATSVPDALSSIRLSEEMGRILAPLVLSQSQFRLDTKLRDSRRQN